MRRKTSIEPDYFERLYREKGDPWGLATSPYERDKYRHTVEAMARPRYAKGLEIGCAIGVLTRQLAERCDALLAVDVSETALAEAAKRCADAANVRFARLQIPQDKIEGVFDLIVLSEVAYYWDRADLQRAATAIRGALGTGADLLLVHYTGATDYPHSADDAVDALHAHLATEMRVIRTDRRERYRLDLWRRSGGPGEMPQHAP